MRSVLVSLVLLGVIACGQSTTQSTAQSEEGSADVAAGQEATAPAAEQAEMGTGEAEKLEDEQTEE